MAEDFERRTFNAGDLKSQGEALAQPIPTPGSSLGSVLKAGRRVRLNPAPVYEPHSSAISTVVS